MSYGDAMTHEEHVSHCELIMWTSTLAGVSFELWESLSIKSIYKLFVET